MNATGGSAAGSNHAAAGEFDRLLRPLIPVLFRHAYRWTAAHDQAEDLVQDLLLRLFPRLEELRKVDRLLPWALRVMYRIFVDQHRRAVNSPVRSMHELGGNDDDSFPHPGAQLADDMPQPPELVDGELLGERLVAAWSQLGEDQRVVVALHDIEGYRLEEVAGMLEVPVGTIKSRLHRARARLRTLLVMEPRSSPVRVCGRGHENGNR